MIFICIGMYAAIVSFVLTFQARSISEDAMLRTQLLPLYRHHHQLLPQ